MSGVLVSFVGGWGHAEPLVPFARAALAAGHDVVVAGQRRIVDRWDVAGVTTEPLGPGTLRSEATPLVPVDRDAERRVMAEHFARRFAAHRAEHLVALIRRTSTEVVVCDEVDFGAVVAAEVTGVPCVTVSVIAAGLMGGHDVVGAEVDVIRQRHGLGPDPLGGRLGGDLVLLPAPPSFRDPRADVPQHSLPIRPAALDRHASPGPNGAAVRSWSGLGSRRPMVLATLGTIFPLESGDLFRRMAVGLGRLDVDVLVTVGPDVRPEALGPVPTNVHVESYVPLAEVLPRVAAVVCHGGSGTVVAALAAGVPLVALPLGADQPDNADRIAALGVGLVLDPVTATPDDIGTATSAVLHDPRHRGAAAALAAELTDALDADAAWGHIETLVRGSRRAGHRAAGSAGRPG